MLVPHPAYPLHNLGNVFHHSYGILFPAVKSIRQRALSDQVVPVHEEYLNSFTSDFLSLLGVDARTSLSVSTGTQLEDSQSIILPRWDYHLLALSWSKYHPEFYAEFVQGFLPRFPEITLFDELAADPDSIEIPLRLELTSLRNEVISLDEIRTENPFQDKVLLIERAPVSDSIHRSEFFKWRGYGKHSRNIMNMDAIEASLREHGVPVVRFTPGIEPIKTQIQAFASCKGVISLRGTELLHALWVPQNAKMIVIETRDLLGGCNYCRIMSDWFEHDYHEIEIRNGRFIQIDPTSILNCF